MRLIDLFEAEIPETSYGYWITEDGEFVVVGYQAHMDRLRDFGLTWKDSRKWIRVLGSTGSRTMNARFDQDVSQKAAKRLYRLIRSWPEKAGYYFDAYSNQTVKFDKEYFFHKSDALRWIAKIAGMAQG